MLQRTQPQLPEGFQLLPAIDLRGGQVVRLSEGDFARETVYGPDPAEVARSFMTAGARWIHVVDLDGARDGGRRQTDAVARIVAAVGDRVACEVAGGLRDEAAVEAALAAGAARVVVGTVALRDPDLVERLIGRFGAARIAIALDVRDGMAVGQGWVPGASGVPVEEALATLWGRGAQTFIVTAIERDGLLTGPNLDSLGTRFPPMAGAYSARLNMLAVAAAEALGTWPIRISRLERGLDFDRDLADKYQAWLRAQEAA